MDFGQILGQKQKPKRSSKPSFCSKVIKLDSFHTDFERRTKSKKVFSFQLCSFCQWEGGGQLILGVQYTQLQGTMTQCPL